MDSHDHVPRHAQDPVADKQPFSEYAPSFDPLHERVSSRGLDPPWVTQDTVCEISSSSSSVGEISTTEVQNFTAPPSNISSRILDIIFEYALNKFSDTKQRLELGRHKFLLVIERFVIGNSRIAMCLPAFPFKSANKVYKVLGILPDKAEEIALERLNNMCLRIKEVYPPGASLMIISDGLVYNGQSGL